MITTTPSESRNVRAICTILAGCMLISLAGPAMRTASATLWVLTDGNSIVRMATDPDAGPDTGPQATAYDWIVRGKDHLKELSNWYRVGGAGPEASVHPLMISETAIDTNPFVDPGLDTLTVVYQDPGLFTMTIVYNLTGGPPGSGFSQLDEDVAITNDSSTPLAFHFFEYLDLDLTETPGDDTSQLTSANSMNQFDCITDYVGTFDADRFENDIIGLPPADTLTKLSNGGADNLANPLPPAPAAFIPVGPDNVSWALQFDFVGSLPPRPVILPGATAFIHKEGRLLMIPEPASAVLALFGGFALLVVRRGQRRGRDR